MNIHIAYEVLYSTSIHTKSTKIIDCSEPDCFDQHFPLTVQHRFSPLCRLCLIPHESLIIHHYYFLDTYLYSILNI